MNANDRKALVGDVAVILQRVKYRDLGASLRPIAEEIIDTVLADRAVPEPDADAVERAAKAMFEEDVRADWGNWDELVSAANDDPDELDGAEAPFFQRLYLRMARAALQAAGDAEWLDTALDSVHPNAAVHVWLESEPEPDVGLPHYFMARLDVNGPDTSDPHYGTGPTRKAAVLNAVAKAKEASGEIPKG